ncbi:MAG: CHAT domain-containing protein, partial [Chitinophagaceae bacterium]
PQSSDFPEQERLYNSLGTIYFESANYQQAKNYFEKALRTLGPSVDMKDESVVTLKSNIANCMLQLRQYRGAINLFRELLRTGMQSRVISHNVAHAYAETKQYDSSLYYSGKVSRQNDIVTVRMLNDIGRIYTEQRRWSNASGALDSSLAIINSLFKRTKNRDRTSNYLLRSLLAEKQQQPNESIKWCNEAIKEVHFNFRPVNIYDVPVNETETLSPITFLELLQQKARLLENRYRVTNDKVALDACFRTHLMAAHTASYIRRCFDNDEAKMYFQQDRSAVYHDALRIAHELTDNGNGIKYIDGLLEINEGYKGSIVYENIRHLDLSARVKLPAWVIEKERSLKRSLGFLTTQLNTVRSSEEAGRIYDNLVTTNVELSRLLALYDRDPAYQLFRNQRAPAMHSFESISKVLDDETAIISFNVTRSNVYALSVTKQGFKTCSITRDSSFNVAFKAFIGEIYLQQEGRRYTGYKASNELYERLLAPLLELTGSKKHWVIMPDDFLSYIPFDALCVKPDGREYLIFNRQISYHYSFSLLMLTMNEPKQSLTARTSFFAPFNKETTNIVASGLAPLPFSATEAPGKNIFAQLSTEATKTNWISSIDGATTLHLATHATT